MSDIQISLAEERKRVEVARGEWRHVAEELANVVIVTLRELGLATLRPVYDAGDKIVVNRQCSEAGGEVRLMQDVKDKFQNVGEAIRIKVSARQDGKGVLHAGYTRLSGKGYRFSEIGGCSEAIRTELIRAHARDELKFIG